MGLIEQDDKKTFLWQEERAFFMGVDIGQANDPSAVAVIERVRQGTGDFDVGPDKTQREKHDQKFELRHLERLPLHMEYRAQVSLIANMLDTPPLDAGCELVVDRTGIGRAIGEEFHQVGIRPVLVTISGGDKAHNDKGKEWSVPKVELVTRLDAALNSADLRVAADVKEAKAFREEMQAFRRHITPSGRMTFSAREGKHDDLVLATCLALWCANRTASEVKTFKFLGW
jgi:hypothetical protein